MAKASHNAVLCKLVLSFTQLMARAGLLLETSAGDLESFKLNELNSHKELYQILRQGNPEESRQAMIEHIARSEQLIVHAFKNAEQEPLSGT